MAYLVVHNGTLWFQIRVPKPLVPKYGALIRLNLQTSDRRTAQPLAFQLAAHWLTQFSVQRAEAGYAPVPELPFQTPPMAAPQLTSVLMSPQWPAGVPEGFQGVPVGNPAGILPASEPPLPAPPRQARSAKKGIAGSMQQLLGYWRQLHPEAVASTYREMASVVKDFHKTVRKAPADIERTDIAAYRDKLIAAGRARSTVSKRVGFISTILQTAFDAGELPQNVARGLKIPKPKVETFRRRAFTAEELKRIFTSPVYTRSKRDLAGGGEAAPWVPLIALATGARLEEICQLMVEDIFVDEVHGPLLRISDQGEGQRIKTTGSRRTIPIHPELVTAGLLDYHERVVESGFEWLFPALEPDHDGRKGGNFGKWFARYLRNTRGCSIRDKQVVFHSFRHTFKTLCREAGLPEEVHDALTGHVSGSVGRGYGYVPLAVLVGAVSKIRFPVALPRVEM